jgi:uncharacterized protein with GYD domain
MHPRHTHATIADSWHRGASLPTKLVESLGGRLREILWTLGEHDIVTVAEFSNDETATAAPLRISSLGNIRSTTMRAFNTDEMASIIARTG